MSGARVVGRSGRGSTPLVLASPTANLRHVAAVAADGLAALLTGLPSFRATEFVCRPLLVGGPSALGGNGPLSLIAHPGEPPPLTRRARDRRSAAGNGPACSRCSRAGAAGPAPRTGR